MVPSETPSGRVKSWQATVGSWIPPTGHSLSAAMICTTMATNITGAIAIAASDVSGSSGTNACASCNTLGATSFHQLNLSPSQVATNSKLCPGPTTAASCSLSTNPVASLQT